MKHSGLLILFIALLLSGYSQNRGKMPDHLKNIVLKKDQNVHFSDDEFLPQIPGLKFKNTLVEEEQIGDTRYDNQSNASIPKKVYKYPDGTIAATWTRSMDEGSFFADRGTGYNYFNGTSWDDWPEERVEDIKVHRPTYAPFGENGEIIVSHTSGTGLYIATRQEKGTGDWDYSTFSGPPSNDYLVWNRVVTSGVDRNRIHLLALTLPSSHGGLPYGGLDGALLYSYSDDGGNSWDMDNEILDGMSSDDYIGFAGDTYAFAEPMNDIVAFVVGDPWTGLFLMKSEDGGLSFEKTVIWEHPYPMWNWGTPTDTFYCADGSQSAVIDNSGSVHVAFGINRVMADANSTYWWPFVDGIAYWNENMPAFSNNLNALSPDGHPDSELIEDYNLIAWTQDVNNNGTIDLQDDIGLYFIGLSSMPQLVLKNNRLILVFCSVTETYDNGLKNYRHIWRRSSPNLGQWWGSFSHLTSDLVHIFDECVYPACSPRADDYLYLNYQYDINPGTAVWGAQHEYVDNAIGFIMDDITFTTGASQKKSEDFEVSQNFPNPVESSTQIKVKLNKPGDLFLSVFELSGKTIYEASKMNAGTGVTTFSIDVSPFASGVYFYTIESKDTSVTKKMIVE